MCYLKGFLLKSYLIQLKKKAFGEKNPQPNDPQTKYFSLTRTAAASSNYRCGNQELDRPSNRHSIFFLKGDFKVFLI